MNAIISYLLANLVMYALSPLWRKVAPRLSANTLIVGAFFGFLFGLQLVGLAVYFWYYEQPEHLMIVAWISSFLLFTTVWFLFIQLNFFAMIQFYARWFEKEVYVRVHGYKRVLFPTLAWQVDVLPPSFEGVEAAELYRTRFERVADAVAAELDFMPSTKDLMNVTQGSWSSAWFTGLSGEDVGLGEYKPGEESDSGDDEEAIARALQTGEPIPEPRPAPAPGSAAAAAAAAAAAQAQALAAHAPAPAPAPAPDRELERESSRNTRLKVALNATDKHGSTPLMVAVVQDKLDSVEDMLSKKADPSVRGKYGFTALGLAVKKGNATLTRTLIRAKADTNTARDDGTTPLMTAVEIKNLGIVRSLLRAKADVNATNKKGKNVLFQANVDGSEDIVRALLDAE